MDKQSIQEGSRASVVKQSTVQEIQKRIVPEGFFVGLDQFNFTESKSFGDSFSALQLTDQQKVLFDAVKKQTGLLSPLVDKLIVNMDFLKEVSNEHAQEGYYGIASRDLIQRYMPEADGYTVDRLFYTVNYGVDPELLLCAMQINPDPEQNHSPIVPPIIIKALKDNPALRVDLVRLLAEGDIDQELFNKASRKEEPYPEEVLSRINRFTQAVHQYTRNNSDATDEDLKKADDYVNSLYNPQNEVLAFTQGENLDSNAYEIVSNLRSYTYKSYSSIPYGGPSNLVDFARAAEVGNYLVSTYDTIAQAYQQFFPEVWIDPNIKLSISKLPDYFKGIINPESAHLFSNYNPINNTVTLMLSDEDYSKLELGEVPPAVEVMIDGRSKKVSKTVFDLICMSHEVSHSIYALFTHRGFVPSVEEMNADSVNKPLTEGFAVLMELLMIDQMKRNSTFFGFDQEDLEAVEIWRKFRLSDLRHNKNYYTEGTLKIMHKLYEEAAGKSNVREMGKGLQAIRRFLDVLDPVRTHNVSQDDPVYREIIQSGDPNRLLQILS